MAFEPFFRFYLAHQRDFEVGVRNLRQTLRDSFTQSSPDLAKLARLDTALDDIVTHRTRRLLVAIPKSLRGRVERLLDKHASQLAEHVVDAPATAGASIKDDPARWLEPQGWLACFADDLQRVLLAELEFRLEPLWGLAAAYDKESKKNG